MERVELDEPRQEGSASDDVCPPSQTPPDSGWVLLPMTDICVYFSLVFSPGSQEPSSLRMIGVTAHMFLLWLILGILCK